MLKTVNVNLDILEMMLFYWESVASKDKISDAYFLEIAKKEEMQLFYNDDFSQTSFIRVLSSISNREKLNNATKTEIKFWSQNMRMIEDLTLTRSMLSPIKTLNLAELVNSNVKDIETLNVIFIPFCGSDFIVEKDTIYFNFFNIIASYKQNGNDTEDNMSEIEVSFHNKNIKDFCIETIKNL